jgi:phage terminase large subunit GpA-like protein
MQSILLKNKDVKERVQDYAFSIFKPRSHETVAEWACKNIRFGEPGNNIVFSTVGREYIIRPLNLLADNKTKEIILVFGVQQGKTAILMSGLAWGAENSSITVTWVWPTEDDARFFSVARLQPMLENSSTRNILSKNRTEKQQLLMFMGSSLLRLVGSNSSSKLAGTPCDWVICDEMDKYPKNPNGESNSVNLAELRTESKTIYKRIKTSTPNRIDGIAWAELLKGNVQRYHMPCPHCEKLVTFAFSPEFYALPKLGCEAYIKWDKAAKIGGVWDINKAKQTAYFECPFCKGKILDIHRTKMIRNGQWIATNPNADKGIESFHCSSLYKKSAAEIVGVFLTSLGSTLGLQGFVNGFLAEPWVNQEMLNRTELIISSKQGITNEDVLILTADYQQLSPRIWYVIRAWKKNGDSVLVNFGNCDSFEELEALQKKYHIINERVVIDSGYDTMTVYNECVKRGRLIKNIGTIPVHIGWIPSKGVDGEYYDIDKKTKQRVCYGFGNANMTHKLYAINILKYNANILKDILWNMRLQKTKEKWAVTEIVNDTYWQHLNAEIKCLKGEKTSQKWVWELRSKIPNHLLDCEVMQLPIAMFIGRIPPILLPQQFIPYGKKRDIY